MRVASAAMALLLAAAAGAQAQPVEVTRPPYPTALMARADEMLHRHDLSGARRLYEVAAGQGVAQAATMIGRTYDPAELAKLGSSVAGDPKEAARWYQRAADLGDPQAVQLLQNLNRKP